MALLLGVLVPSVTVPSAAGAAQCHERRPSVVVTPESQSITPGGITTYDVKVRNLDSRGCSAVTFLVQAAAYQHSVEFMVLPGNYVWASFKPQQTKHFTLRARAETDATPGTYEGGVFAGEWDNREHLGAAFVDAVIG